MGELDQDGTYTGEAAYLYPDLSTALVGVFEDGRLVKGREARLAGLYCESGLLRPRWTSCCMFLNQIYSLNIIQTQTQGGAGGEGGLSSPTSLQTQAACQVNSLN